MLKNMIIRIPLPQAIQVPLSIFIPSFSLSTVLTMINNFESLYNGLTWDNLFIIN